MTSSRAVTLPSPRQRLALVALLSLLAGFGCGMGLFTIALAKLVGEQGRVIAADLQPQMLDVVLRRARRAGVADRIRTHRCQRDSIALQGVCHTVVAKDAGGFEVDTSAATLAVTTGLDEGREVNLEKSLTLADRLGGHLVSGHVDGVGSVVAFEDLGAEAIYRLRVEDFPIIVVNDTHGGDFYEDVLRKGK